MECGDRPWYLQYKYLNNKIEKRKGKLEEKEIVDNTILH